MPKINFTVSKSTDEALKRYSEETNAPVAALLREAIEEWAARRGIDLDTDVSWGGRRRTIENMKGEDRQGQFVAAGVR